MKYWKKGNNSNGYGEEAIILKCDDDYGDRVLSVTQEEDGKVMFMEECDGCFSVSFTKQEAVEMVNELLNFIKNSI
jgi:Fe-S cluster biogenesis protein NfuA